MEAFDPFARSFWITIGTASLCGAIVGLERQLRGKPAGVRTSILICLGTALFVKLGMEIVGSGDATRVLGQVVTGIGFLGAGVMFTREGAVLGVTTAAVIWLLAAIGATIGFGFLPAALAIAGVTVVLLTGVDLLESSFRLLTRGAYSRDADDTEKREQ